MGGGGFRRTTVDLGFVYPCLSEISTERSIKLIISSDVFIVSSILIALTNSLYRSNVLIALSFCWKFSTITSDG